MSLMTLTGRGLIGGVVEGEALVSSETISGWGGVDPMTGTVIETRHPLRGICFAGKILVFPGAKGSSGWSVAFHTTRLRGVAPAGLVFVDMSTKAALGALVLRVPAVTDLDGDPIAFIRSGDIIRVDGDRGQIDILARAADRQHHEAA